MQTSALTSSRFVTGVPRTPRASSLPKCLPLPRSSDPTQWHRDTAIAERDLGPPFSGRAELLLREVLLAGLSR